MRLRHLLLLCASVALAAACDDGVDLAPASIPNVVDTFTVNFVPDVAEAGASILSPD